MVTKPSNLPMQEFFYRFPDKVFGHIPGAHSGSAMGSGDRFAGFADLFDYPDPRRLDLRASIRSQAIDSTQHDQHRWLVRRYQQRSSITLWLLADMSQSMVLATANKKRLAELAQMIAYSAIGLGDQFAMTGFDHVWRQDVSIMPTRQRSMPAFAADKILRSNQALKPGAEGMLNAAGVINSKRALVFLVSDFCCDVSLVERTLRKLAHFTVIPIVWQHDDVDLFPSHAGWTETRDAETGQRHSVWMRPSLRKRWLNQRMSHFAKLDACFRRYQFKPLYVRDTVSPQQLTAYFFAMKKS
ncbi:putative MxaS-like protein [Methylophaga frappieri]|uniref:Putative MxaS-like protein n=1 Tax=Methylophaga frappieri (strain ATCC BAA-2434 / DSM 25690 / JAM7) TaxID=754477 RepID=I1YEY8_METFJ|nr:MxaS-like protein [Methylophaga frappieri]AFJ01481.1 putative MxaS-like protein [Methylophaga frappieri]